MCLFIVCFTLLFGLIESNKVSVALVGLVNLWYGFGWFFDLGLLVFCYVEFPVECLLWYYVSCVLHVRFSVFSSSWGLLF